MVLILLVTVICCCGCTRHKEISPANDVEQPHEETKEGDKPTQDEYIHESLNTKNHPTTHHQLQQSGPIYEAIESNENSSTNSQGSPSSKPLATTDLYSTLDQSGMYAQISPHISTAVTAGFEMSSSDSCYQELNHNIPSLKRASPNSHPLQAVNKTALAMEEGLVEETDLNSPGHSNQQPVSGGSRKRDHLEVVQLKDTGIHSQASDQGSVYNTLDPLPHYNTLEQLEKRSEISTTAMCNNKAARSSPNMNSTSKSATLPGIKSSPRLTRTRINSSSSSPSMSPKNKSSHHWRQLSGEKKVINTYTESPVASKKFQVVHKQIDPTDFQVSLTVLRFSLLIVTGVL